MSCRLTSVEAQVERVFEAQIQAMRYQRTVDDWHYDEAMKQFRDIASRVDSLEVEASVVAAEDVGDDECALLNNRMSAFERMAAASEEAMDDCLKQINKRVRDCETMAKQIDTEMAEFVDHFSSRADMLEQRFVISEGVNQKTAEEQKSSAQQHRERHVDLDIPDIVLHNSPAPISDVSESEWHL